MDNSATQRESWISEILDVLSNRSSEGFSHHQPDSLPRIAQMLSQRNWDEILSSNILGSSNFHTILRRILELAPREMTQDKTHRIHSRIGVIRGRLLATETSKQRVLQRSPSLWVSQESSKIWQTPTNAALAGFFHSLVRITAASTATQPLAVRQGMILVSLLVRSEPFRHVDPDMNWKSFDVPAALSTKSEFYKLCETWMSHYRIASRSRDSNSIRATLLGGWLISEKDERLLELYALSVTLKAIMKIRDWDLLELRSSARVNGATQIIATKGDVIVRVDFDNSPSTQGRYRWILNRYSAIDGRGRRPDLQITSAKGSRVLTTLVEVKATSPNSPYGRDSVVKVMGYLHDFAELWSDEATTTYSRAVLLYRESVGALVDCSIRAATDEILLSDPEGFEADLSAVLERHLSLL